jgi:hypothetical protein
MFIVENLKPFTLMFYKEERKRQKKNGFPAFNTVRVQLLSLVSLDSG